jgi:hypothetical protein
MIKTIFKAFIGIKLFQLILSIVLLILTYNIFPQPFHFIIQTLRNIK